MLEREVRHWSELSVVLNPERPHGSPMVWSQLTAAMPPVFAVAVAEWLESWDGFDQPETAPHADDWKHALQIARLVNRAVEGGTR
nr:hypothetical protein GCM10010200_035930 [Actinomadura rugatobispora]